MQAVQQVSKTTGKNYNAIDLMRMICAILVICVHVYPLTMFGEQANFVLVHAVARIAVPFFCVTSGFFFFQKIEIRPKTPQAKKENRHALFHFIRRILVLYIVWSVLYLPIQIANAHIMGNTWDWKTYLQEAVYYTTYLHLWYFPALILGIVITYLLIRFLPPIVVLGISGVLYGIGLFGDAYYGFLWKSPELIVKMDRYLEIFHTTRNGLFFVFFFVAMGTLFAQRNIRIKKWISGSLALVSLFALIWEAVTLSQKKIPIEYNLYISLIPLAFFLFVFLRDVTLKDGPQYRLLREMSVLIYCSHELFRQGISLLFFYHPEWIKWQKIYQISLVSFGVILLLSVLFSLLILFLQKKCRMTWLKWIH